MALNLSFDATLWIDGPARQQPVIFALCAEGSTNARLETDASQFEDVVSQLVVYSNEQAKPLRSLAT